MSGFHHILSPSKPVGLDSKGGFLVHLGGGPFKISRATWIHMPTSSKYLFMQQHPWLKIFSPSFVFSFTSSTIQIPVYILHQKTLR